MARCHRCGKYFGNVRQLGPHRRHCLSTSEEEEEESSEFLSDASAAEQEPQLLQIQRHQMTVITTPANDLTVTVGMPANAQLQQMPHVDMRALARRRGNWGIQGALALPRRGTASRLPARDVREMQKIWGSYVKLAYRSCSPEFWEVFQKVIQETTSCKDQVLGVVKKLMKQDRTWPSSVRTLRTRITRKAGKFWAHVMETHTIDVRSFGIPKCTTVQFSFVDPIFLWAQRCAALAGSGIKLHWDAKTLMDPETQEEIYGAGIIYALYFAHTCAHLHTYALTYIFCQVYNMGHYSVLR